MVPRQAGTGVEEVRARRGHDALVEVGAAAVVADVVEADVEVGNPEDLGLRQLGLGDPDPAWAAATISGRASESRRAVARLIGKRRSVGSGGAERNVGMVVSGEGGDDPGGGLPPYRHGGRSTAQMGLVMDEGSPHFPGLLGSACQRLAGPWNGGLLSHATGDPEPDSVYQEIMDKRGELLTELKKT